MKPLSTFLQLFLKLFNLKLVLISIDKMKTIYIVQQYQFILSLKIKYNKVNGPL